MKGSIQGAYNAWGPRYDSDDNATRDLNAVVLRQQALDLSGGAVLELGCGTGRNTEWLAARARRVVGLDLAEGMLAAAQRRLAASGVRLVQADLTRPWPLLGPFDLIVANLVLEHVDDLAPVFRQAARVLRAGGRLYLAELHPYKQLAGSQARFRDPQSGREVRVPAFRHSISDYVNAGLEAGFSLRHVGEWPAASQDPPRLLTLLFELARRDAPTSP